MVSMSSTALRKFADLARKAGRWVGLGTSAPARPVTVVEGDRFDVMTWTEVRDQATALAKVEEELSQRFDYVPDLLRDVFLTVYKADPVLRDPAGVEPTRLPNHAIVSALVGTPEYADLHRETVGDEYAAAMAVIAQRSTLAQMLEQSQDAQQAAEQSAAAEQEAAERATAVEVALGAAADQVDDDGAVPDQAAAAVDNAVAAAHAADDAAQQARAQAEAAAGALGTTLRADARQAMASAAEQAREEAALMAAWGLGPGQLQRMSFDERARLAERLRGGRLGKFTDLVGRFRRLATAERTRKLEHVAGELVGITLGDDLTRLIPSEAANLAHPALRAVFAARFAEKQLMLYETMGEDHSGRGAIIACLDCSYSMCAPHTGPDGRIASAEAWAKACGLALLDQARAEGRDFVGILFSSAEQVSVHRFPAGEAALDQVLDFAETFFSGGTDFQTPLGAAVDILAENHGDEAVQGGDIVLITDGEAEVAEEWMRTWKSAKSELDFRLFGVAITDPRRPAGRSAVLEALCDNLRTLDDLADPHPAADLFRVI
ncbi:vWA domain-containing protein [Nocardia farcinica]|nr:hypothetical protein [Nocardia farcinica]AXK89956.1 hypothetical protein DXT66_29640 [Nocardia farcinica]